MLYGKPLRVLIYSGKMDNGRLTFAALLVLVLAFFCSTSIASDAIYTNTKLVSSNEDHVYEDPIPAGTIQMAPSTSQKFTWDVRLHERLHHQYLEVHSSLMTTNAVHLNTITITLSNLEPDLSLTPVPVEDYWTDPNSNPAAVILSCEISPGEDNCVIRKVCDLPHNVSRWYVLISSEGRYNNLTPVKITPHIRHVYLHPITLDNPTTVTHNLSPNTSSDFATAFNFFSLEIPLEKYVTFPFGSRLSLDIDVLSPSGALLDVFGQMDSLPSPCITTTAFSHKCDSCFQLNCTSEVGSPCNRVKVDYTLFRNFGVWYFAIVPQWEHIPSSAVTYRVTPHVEQPKITALGPRNELFDSLHHKHETNYYTVTIPANESHIMDPRSTFMVILENINGGAAELRVAHNSIPSASSKKHRCETNATHSCVIFFDFCHFNRSGVYIAAVQARKLELPNAPLSFTIRASVDAPTEPHSISAAESLPDVIESGQLSLYDVDIHDMDRNSFLNVEVYTPELNSNLTAFVFHHKDSLASHNDHCVDYYAKCHTETRSDFKSSSCLLQIPPCYIREHQQEQGKHDRRHLRIGVSRAPAEGRAPQDFTIRTSRVPAFELEHKGVHRDRVSKGEYRQYLINSDNLPAGSEVELKAFVSRGGVTIYRRYGDVAGDIHQCLTFESQTSVRESGHTEFTMSNCRAVDPSPKNGIFFGIQGLEEHNEFVLTLTELKNHTHVDVKNIYSGERLHGNIEGSSSQYFSPSNLGNIAGGDRSLFLHVTSSSDAPKLVVSLVNTNEIICVNKSVMHFSCALRNGRCSVYIPPCLITDAKWTVHLENRAESATSFTIDFSIVTHGETKLLSGVPDARTLMPHVPKHYSLDVDKIDYENDPRSLLVEVYTAPESADARIGLYGLAPMDSSSDTILAGPNQCFAHDRVCVEKGKCSLLINSYELRKGKYRFAVISHSTELINIKFTVKASLLPTRFDMEDGVPRLETVVPDLSVFYRIDVHKSIHNKNETSNKALYISLTPQDIQQGLALTAYVLSKPPQASHVWGAGPRCLDAVERCNVNITSTGVIVQQSCMMKIEYCRLNPQPYWLMVTAHSKQAGLIHYSAMSTLKSPSLPLQDLPVDSCYQSGAISAFSQTNRLNFSISNGEYVHFKLVWPAGIRPNEDSVRVVIGNFVGGFVHFFTNRNDQLATEQCSDATVSCRRQNPSSGFCSIPLSCLSGLNFVSAQGDADSAAPVQFTLSACYQPINSMNLSHASPRVQRQIPIVDPTEPHRLRISLDTREIQSPELTLAVSGVTGAMEVELRSSFCDSSLLSSTLVGQCPNTTLGHCLIELNYCDLQLAGAKYGNASTNLFDLFVVIKTMAPQRAVNVVATIHPAAATIVTLPIGTISTITLGPSESRTFSIPIPPYEPPIHDQYVKYRLQVYLTADSPDSIEAALVGSPYLPALPLSHRACELALGHNAGAWTQMVCTPSTDSFAHQPCLIIQSCSLRTGYEYVLTVRNKVWDFDAANPVPPVNIQVHAQLVIDAQFSPLHIGGPETRTPISSSYKNELVGDLTGLDRTDSLVVTLHSKDLFHTYISRVTPAGNDSACFTHSDHCLPTISCAKQMFGCDIQGSLPSSLYFDVEPLRGDSFIHSLAVVQKPIQVVVNTPITSQSIGAGLYKHYVFEVPSHQTIANYLEVVISGVPLHGGLLRGFLNRYGSYLLAGDPKDTCLSYVDDAKCTADADGICRIVFYTCGESGLFSVGIHSLFAQTDFSVVVNMHSLNVTGIRPGHISGVLHSPDGTTVTQIYSLRISGKAPHEFLRAKLKSMDENIMFRWTTEHSCTYAGHCIATFGKNCEIYIPPGHIVEGAYYFAVQTVASSASFELDVEHGIATVPNQNVTTNVSDINFNTLYKGEINLGETQIFRLPVSAANLSQHQELEVLVDYVRGGAIEAWITESDLTDGAAHIVFCRSNRSDDDEGRVNCRLSLPACELARTDLSGIWHIGVRATHQPHAVFNVSVQYGFVALLSKKTPHSAKKSLIPGGSYHIHADWRRTEGHESELKLFPRPDLFHYDIPNRPHPAVGMWFIKLKTKPFVKSAKLELSLDEPGSICIAESAGTCTASEKNNFTCKISLSSCSLREHSSVFAWVKHVEFDETTLDSEDRAEPVLLGEIIFLALDDASIPLLSPASDTRALLHKGQVFPGVSDFFVIDLSLISQEFMLSLKFDHNGDERVQLLASFVSPPDDPNHGCGQVVCDEPNCLAMLEGCIASFFMSERLYFAVNYAVTINDDRPAPSVVDYSLRFSFNVSIEPSENERCYSMAGGRYRWFRNHIQLKEDEILRVKLVHSETSRLATDSPDTGDLGHALIMGSDGKFSRQADLAASLRLYLSPLFPATQICHSISCDPSAIDGSCSLFWRCDSPSDDGIAPVVSVAARNSDKIYSYYLHKHHLKVDVHWSLDSVPFGLPANNEHANGTKEKLYDGEFVGFRPRSKDSLVLIRLETRQRDLFAFYSTGRVNYGCGDTYCMLNQIEAGKFSCWMISDPKGRHREADYLHVLSASNQTAAPNIVINMTEIPRNTSNEAPLSLNMLREFEIKSGDFLSVPIEIASSQAPDADPTVTFNLHLYGIPDLQDVYSAWISFDGPSSPDDQSRKFTRWMYKDHLSFQSSVCDVSGKRKPYLNVFVHGDPQPFNLVRPLAAIARFESSADPNKFEGDDVIHFHSFQKVRVRTREGKPQKLIWTPTQVKLDRDDVIFVKVSNLTGGSFVASVGSTGPQNSSELGGCTHTHFAFKQSTYWRSCLFESILASRYMILVEAERQQKSMPDVSFDLEFIQLSPTALKSSGYDKHKREFPHGMQRVTHQFENFDFFVAEPDLDKANLLYINVTSGPAVNVEVTPVDSRGCKVAFHKEEPWNRINCYMGQLCSFSWASPLDVWTLRRSGVRAFHIAISGSSSYYNIHWASGKAVCADAKMDDNDDHICRSGDAKDAPKNTPRLVSISTSSVEAASTGASKLFEQIKERFRCPPTDGLCYELSSDCHKMLKSFSCNMAFPTCDKDGFTQRLCVDTCRAVEVACNRTFDAVDLSQFSCLSSSYVNGSAEIKDGTTQTCSGCPLGSACARLITSNHLSEPLERKKKARTTFAVVFTVAIAILLLILLLFIIRWVRGSRQASRDRDEPSRPGGEGAEEESEYLQRKDRAAAAFAPSEEAYSSLGGGIYGLPPMRPQSSSYEPLPVPSHQIAEVQHPSAPVHDFVAREEAEEPEEEEEVFRPSEFSGRQ